uniref:Uncharacterized protein n=1 Tax=viral metagenome TaxID=1070528 RepID=A0A6C0I3C0_9ZZZZ
MIEADDCQETLLEYFMWIIGYIDGCIISFFMGKEEKHRKKRPEHDYVDELEHGCEAGCAEGEWLSGYKKN